jgi:hypothetical protein
MKRLWSLLCAPGLAGGTGTLACVLCKDASGLGTGKSACATLPARARGFCFCQTRTICYSKRLGVNKIQWTMIS